MEGVHHSKMTHPLPPLEKGELLTQGTIYTHMRHYLSASGYIRRFRASWLVWVYFPSLPGREREYRPDTGQGHFRLPHQEGEEVQVMETDAFSRYIKITLVM